MMGVHLEGNTPVHEEPEHFKGMTEEQKNSERYKWAIEHGYHCRDAVIGTPSMSIGRGPYLQLDVPSLNRFSGWALTDKQTADAVIDTAIIRQARQKADKEADELAIREWKETYGLT